MEEIKRIGVVSLGKILGISGIFFGLIAALFFWLFFSALLGGLSGTTGTSSLLTGGIGASLFIIFPILYGISGFIGGMIYALIYNVVAMLVGGLKIQMITGSSPY